MFVRLTKCDYWKYVRKRAILYLQKQMISLHWLDLNACQESCGISICSLQGRTDKINQNGSLCPRMGLKKHMEVNKFEDGKI